MARPPAPGLWTRDEAIARLRRRLTSLCGEESSLCRVAAERGFFCRGFRRWHDAEFHERWKVVLGESTHLSRAQVEQLADIWQLGEQIRHRVGLACDAQSIAHGACRGWDEFSDETLAGFCSEVLGCRVKIGQNAANDANGSGSRNAAGDNGEANRPGADPGANSSRSRR